MYFFAIVIIESNVENSCAALFYVNCETYFFQDSLMNRTSKE